MFASLIRHLIVAGLLLCVIGHGGTARGSVVITEFMAQNIRGIVDEDADRPDWVELFNSGVEPVNLGGWYLTDNPLNLNKWKFPSTNLPPQKHMVVFLSGKDRAVSGAPLHTDFRLNADEDYLALVQPDGETIESETPSPFPPQVADVAYGVPVKLESTLLVPAGSDARFLVPLNSFLETTWRELETDDSAWRLVRTGVGFEVTANAPEAGLVADSEVDFEGTQGANGWVYGYYNKTTDPNNNYNLVDFVAFPSEGEAYGLENFWNGTSWKWAPSNPPWTEIGSVLMRPTASTSGGHEHWPIRRWVSTVDGTVVIDWRIQKQVSTGSGVTLRILHKGTGKATNVLAGADTVGTSKSLSLPGVKVGDAIDFMVGSVGVGGSTSDEGDLVSFRARISVLTSLDSSIATSVKDAMHNKNSTAWLRIPFTVENPAMIQRLLLRLKYDDGFVAWINGVEVAHDNAPTDLKFDSAATAARSEQLAASVTELDLTPRLGVLKAGENLLAIQGLNVGKADADFLMAPELVATRVVLETGQFLYMSPATPGALNGAGNTNLGPVVVEVNHSPQEPADTEDLAITARVARTFRDIAGVSLRWRIMYSNEVSTAMFDDGKHADGAAGDGVWGAIIPARSHTNGQMIRWYVAAADTRGNTNSNPAYPDPKASPRYYGTVHRDVTLTNRLPVLHWFLPTPLTAADSTTGARSSFYYNGQFYDNVFVNLHGQSSAGFPKHSYNVDFNRGYQFQYAPDSPRVDDINLLTTWPDKAKMRNVLAYESHRDAGFAYHFVIPIRVQRNAAFFGDWHMVEDGGEEYLERVGLSPQGALYKMYDTFAGVTPAAEKKTRKTEPNADLAELYRGISRTGAAKTQYLYDNVDIPGMVNYLAIMILVGNVDCCHKNYYAYRDTEGTKEWKWLPWDQDLSFGRNWTAEKAYEEDKMFLDNGFRIGENNTLIAALFADSKFLSMYYRRLRTLMDTFMQPTNTPPEKRYYENRIAELAYNVAPDAALDFKKWPTWGTKQTLEQAVAILTNVYLPGRRRYLYGQSGTGRVVPPAQSSTLQLAFGDYEVTPSSGNSDEEYLVVRNPNAVAVDISKWKLRGDVEHEFTPGTVLPANGSLYLSPNVVAFRARTKGPRGGQGLFVQGSYRGRLSARGGSLTLLDGQRTVATITVPSNPTPAQKWLRVTEIHFEPAAPPNGSPYAAEEFEFLELTNIGPSPINLSQVRLTDGVEFNFATSSNTNLVAGGSMILVRNAAAFRSRYGQGLPVAGVYTGRLDNNGERIRVEDQGEVVLDFRYPTAGLPRAHGEGRSITVVDANGYWNDWSENLLWAESDTQGGSPGTYSSNYAFWAAQRFNIQEMFDPAISGPSADPDSDGESNLSEFVLGSNPRDIHSRFGIRPHVAGGMTRLQFQAASGRTYTVQVRSGLQGGEARWTPLFQVPAGGDRTVAIEDPVELNIGRFYRLVTPGQP
jgi:hypothetical protein